MVETVDLHCMMELDLHMWQSYAVCLAMCARPPIRFLSDLAIHLESLLEHLPVTRPLTMNLSSPFSLLEI